MSLLKSLRRKNPGAKAARALAEGYPDIVEPEFKAALAACRSATMTSVERLYALHSAVRYVAKAKIPGGFVECGVWQGGSVMMMALTLKSVGITDRDLHLFDTFEGMTAPTDKDVDLHGGKMQDASEKVGDWHRAPMDLVRGNLARTGYPMSRFHLAQGDVLKTIPGHAPERIALLRLDTDWYESTKHELEHLFPRLSPRGVLIIDDYGHFKGAREAVDEYLGKQKEKYLLQRVDYTARLLIKG